jgi:glycosyltransferase involved in cell wall biosynthesis
MPELIDTAASQPEKHAGRKQGGRRIRGHLKEPGPDMPLVTVITVVFNGAATLEDTIRSVIAQTYGNIEYIVVDGGSTDATPDILRKYEGNIDYWVSETDAGIYDAMNKGIALARGDYIGMLNSDDFFASRSTVEKIVMRLKASNADAVFANLDIVDSANPDRVFRKYRVASYTPFMLRIGMMPAHPTFYCRKSCYEKAGPYSTDYRIAADFEMLARLLLKQHITWSFMDETTVRMRAGGLSTRGIGSSWVVNREIVRACSDNGLYTNMFMLALKLPVRLLERVL